jgi:hypothetical protein
MIGSTASASALSRACSLAMALFAACVAAEPGGAAALTTGSFDRIVAAHGKREIPCPAQGPKTAVLLVIGQSNSANHAERPHQTLHGAAVANLLGGKCYEASSPLLGAEGTKGESFTLLGNHLIEAGLYEQVVLVASGIGGTEIRRWRQGGDLNGMLIQVVDGAHARYRFTHVLWHQGESDAEHTSTIEYEQSFRSLVASLREHGVTAPVFVSVASWCDVKDWTPANPVADAQRALVDPAKGIFAGVDTDSLIPRSERYDDCHFGSVGQEKFAAAWRDILRRHEGH